MRLWQQVFEALRDTRLAEPDIGSDLMIWHGGEPLLLLPNYLLDVLALQKDILGPALASGAMRNAVQTNLYTWNQTLEIFLASGFDLSVSIDMAPGVRMTAGNRDAEAQSLQNLETLVDRGADVGVILVLGRHNHDHLIAAYDRLAAIGINWLRIVSAFEVANSAPIGDLILTSEETLTALLVLAEHREQVGYELPVTPLDRAALSAEYFGQSQPPERKRPKRIIVQPDGRIGFSLGERRPIHDWPTHQSLTSVVAECATIGATDREARVCGPCRFQSVCDRRALEDFPDNGGAGPCPIESRLIGHYVDKA